MIIYSVNTYGLFNHILDGNHALYTNLEDAIKVYNDQIKNRLRKNNVLSHCDIFNDQVSKLGYVITYKNGDQIKITLTERQLI